MGKALLLLALTIPLFANAQFVNFGTFNIDYNSTTNTMTVEYGGCDPCLLGGVVNASDCLCRRNCNEEREECAEQCAIDFNGIPAIRDCVDACIAEEAVCLTECGPEPQATTEIVAYQYSLFAFASVIGTDPLSNPAHQDAFFSTVITGNQIIIAPFSPMAPWPGISSTHNTCYAIIIAVEYANGNICQFIETECFLLG